MEPKTTTMQLLVTELKEHAITKEELEKKEQESDMWKKQAIAWYEAYQKLLTTGKELPKKPSLFNKLFPSY